ncbi:hypothetical protein EN766_26800 [Mesorhizobium sp. M2A.F.Ca.ET.046.02.1.1]|nr:hypothetical protein EN766_26800 [Mesorhizobium sp. M2A.F.Ca.ET.046.02.1.1]
MAIAGFMIAGPAAEQVFGVQSPWLRSWTMFSAIGLDVIDASFEIRGPTARLSRSTVSGCSARPATAG